MAEFADMMRQWERMCKAMKEEHRLEMCDNCPLRDTICMFKPFEHCTKIEEAENTIKQWAKDNPEPVYPQWVQWLADMGLITGAEFDSYEPIMGDSKSMISYRILATPKAFERIPEDFAKKAGIATVAPENVHKMIFDAMNSIDNTEVR